MQPTIPARLMDNARRMGDRPAIWSRGPDDTWTALTWADYAARARAFGGALIARGIEPGQSVGILSNNRAEWLIAATGALAAGAVPVGLYPTLLSDQVAYVLSHCRARLVVVEDAEQWAKVSAAIGAAKLDAGLRGVVMDPAGLPPEALEATTVFAALLDEGAGRDDEVDTRTAAIGPDDRATLIYTSGTTGTPKGVVLTHHNLAWTAARGPDIIEPPPGPDDAMVSYLPLCHIAEQMLSLHVAITCGFPVWMCERLEHLRDVLPAARPTIFMGVPRVWEKFQAALEGRLAELTGARGLIAKWALAVGAEAGPTILDEGPPTGWLGVRYRLADKLFFTPLRARLGLDRLRMAITGAAPLGEDVARFFLSLGIVLHEVYGQSEASGPTSFARNVPGDRRFGTVGRPIPGVEVRIAADGEVCVRGGNVFAGYLDDPAATDATLIGGWLHSGDLGELDDDGFLRITGRKKDLIITAGGKNVGPGAIEAALKAIDGVAHAVVIGDRRKYLAAVMTLEPESAARLAEARGWPTAIEALSQHDGFRAHVQAAVDGINAHEPRYKQIKRFALLPTEFTAESGELTPTQKVKRRVVESKYRDVIDGLYPDA